uniref:hypothetical protein n=1 Tax=Methylobacterium radiotolerans TaxID=31998 RepID=UPI002738D1F5|nr:hypothetical protein [Methylobacterium radiotolerans]
MRSFANLSVRQNTPTGEVTYAGSLLRQPPEPIPFLDQAGVHAQELLLFIALQGRLGD